MTMAPQWRTAQLSSSCEGAGTNEGVLGYCSSSPRSGLLALFRALRTLVGLDAKLF